MPKRSKVYNKVKRLKVQYPKMMWSYNRNNNYSIYEMLKNRNLKILSFCILTLLIILALISGCSNGATVLKLPGQTETASRIMIKALNDVQSKIDKPINIYDIQDYFDPIRRTSRGLTSWTPQEVQIWLNPSLEYDDQEAVAAHELAHVLQSIEGYYSIKVPPDKQEKHLFLYFSRLGGEICAMVLDANADGWAEQQGFKVEEGLRSDYLPGVIKNINYAQQSGYVEAIDWDNYYEWLRNLAKATVTGEEIQTTIPQEFFIQMTAVQYAKFKLRLSPYGLFSEIDNATRQNFPIVWKLGNELASLVEENGMSNKHQCNSAIIKIVEYLKIPPPLLIVANPKNEDIVWPKTQ